MTGRSVPLVSAISSLDGSEHGATGTNCSRLTVTAVSGQRAEVSSELVLVRVRFLLVLVLVVERVL